ncbi:MAG TPA: ATP-binding protein [Burkholderiaceae bacterium]|jgi:nitrogen fixation/metabolism regulation signal transduction histidine kinase
MDSPVPPNRYRMPLVVRWVLLVAALLIVALTGLVALLHWLPDQPLLAALLSFLAVLPVAIVAVRSQLEPMLSMFRALAGTATSYKDGDYSFGLRWNRSDEVGDLVDAHNLLGDVLRAQRLGLVQRELLLDTMVQNTPVAMLLVADGGPIVFANLAARQMLNQGRKLEGLTLAAVLEQAHAALREAVMRGGDGLFTVVHELGDDEEEVYHLARRGFHLNGRSHELLLLRLLTAELRRQEVLTWKKVIRVISHELNNSLAPIASLAASGGELLRRGQPERLENILATIAERSRHLEDFILGYARFAKLPAPRLQHVAWPEFLDRLAMQYAFARIGDVPHEPGNFDATQIEQALLNLLKNAHESGSAPDQISLTAVCQQGVFRIDVMDRGSGMNETVLTNALIPFYSTKRSGTGLGLALTREIVEAHGGRITLANREGGGLTASVILPLAMAS